MLPFADASFDVVSCRAAFHHFPRPERILGEICRVARPAASIVIADLLGSEDSAKAAHHDHMERLCDPIHVRAIPETGFRRLFAAAGLEVRYAGKSPLDITERGLHQRMTAPATASTSAASVVVLSIADT